jgi:hypothetical protein
MNDQRLKEKAQQYRIEQLEKLKRFVAFRTDSLQPLYNLSANCLKVFIYLKSNINRDAGYKDEHGQRKTYPVWANLDKYFNDGYLATARTQGRIAKDVGLLRPNVNRAIKQLIKAGVIKDIGTEKVFIGGQNREVPIHALGQVIESHNSTFEVYFYEISDVSK